MADSYSPSKLYSLDSELTSSMRPNPSKSYPHFFFFKSLIILIIIILLPLFPSQAPEFLNLNKIILTKHWELLHLLFIGIFVSYGLFSSRRNVPMNIETHSNINITQTYLSGISHVSSIFEDGFENLRGSDEKRVTQSWNNQYLHSESMGVFTNGSSVLYEHKKCGSHNADHVFDELPNPKPKSSFGYKPLGLPIRSLRSRVVDSENPEPINVGGSSSMLKGSSMRVDKINKDEIRRLVPINLEEKFKETVVPSPIPWGSRSFRMERKEELGTLKPSSSRSRPFSVGEFEFDSLKSQSFRLPKASHTSSKDSSSIFSSLSSVTPKLPNPKTEDAKREKSSHGTSLQASPDSRPSFAPSNGDPLFGRSNTQRFSIGSSSEVNSKRGFKDTSKDFGKNKIWDCFGQGNQVVDSLNSDRKGDKFKAISKGKSRGKSVRTIRPSETFLEAMKTEHVCPIQIDDKVETLGEKLEYVSMEKQNLDNLCSESNQSLLKYQKGQRQVLADGTIVESERESESDFDNFQASSDEEKCEPETDSGEVDKKASEFIAKFKEQIRLQKVNSIKGLNFL